MAEDTPQSVNASETEKTTALIPQAVRNLHGKALAAVERDNFDIAIDLFLKCLQTVPAYHAARRNLRLAEVAKFKRSGKGKFAHQISSLTGLSQKIKAQALIKTGKGLDALMAAEHLMKMDPLNPAFGDVYMKAALAAKLPEAGVMTLEILNEYNPSDIDNVERLGILYSEIQNYKAARECFEKVVKRRPSDSDVLKRLKDTEALATLDSGWEEAEREGKDYKSVLANKDQAEQLERAAKAVKTADDAEALITEARAKIAADPNNLNYYLNLGHLFMQQKRFDDAIGVYMDAQKINAADPELDRRMASARIARFDAEAAALRAENRAEDTDAKEAEKNQFVFDNIVERVQRYPNDLRLRFELGMQYFQYEHYDDAIQQFQLAQRSPKDRVQASFHLALCFKAKDLADMAISELEGAIELLPSMTPEKLDVLYALAELYQFEKRLDDAARLYKEIYRADVTYRDIAKKVEEIYAAQKEAKEASRKAGN